MIEASIPKDELNAKFIEKGGDIDKHGEIMGQKRENHEGGVQANHPKNQHHGQACFGILP